MTTPHTTPAAVGCTAGNHATCVCGKCVYCGGCTCPRK